MLTEIFDINNMNDLEKDCAISKAAGILSNNGLVAFPTETVYGLGANALDSNAVNKIFEAKGRPNDNPLIVHISSTQMLNKLTAHIPDFAYKLIERFWPGPLTMVFEKSEAVPNVVSANLNTVGIRMPNEPIALALIQLSGKPIAAPSANISGRPSPTRGQHVVDDLNGKVDCIVIGNDCNVGVESTVLDVTVFPPVILRPGGVTPKQIIDCVGDVKIHSSVTADKNFLAVQRDQVPKSPGMKYKHYSPNAEFFMIRGDTNIMQKKIIDVSHEFNSENKKIGILCCDESREIYLDKLRDISKNIIVFSAGSINVPEQIAANIFALLRDFDTQCCDVIVSEYFGNTDINLATQNRLSRVAGENIIDV